MILTKNSANFGYAFDNECQFRILHFLQDLPV
jgi:hypothetical protein